MPRFFKHPKKEREVRPGTNKRALAIAGTILTAQEAAARWLTRRFSALPRPAQVVCLLLFCLVLGGTSGWVLATAVMTGPEEVPGMPHVVPGPAAPTPAAPPHLPPAQQRQPRPHVPDTLKHPTTYHPF